MFLEHIDIDVYGPHRKLSIGPLGPALNAVYGLPGAGKTAIVDFVRAVMLGGTRWHSHAAGRVVWCDNDGLLVCRREVDGTPTGRLTMERLSRDGRGIYAGYAALARDAFPTDWLDAFVAPSGTSLEQARQALAAAQRAGLDVSSRREVHPEAAQVRRQYESVDREYQDIARGAEDPVALEERRANLRRQLERTPAEHDHRAYDRWLTEQRHAESEWEAAKRELNRCETSRSDLVRSIAVLRDELAGLAPIPAETNQRFEINAHDRAQLEALDARLVRWRRTLREIRDLRQQLEDRATDLRIDTQVIHGGNAEFVNPRLPLHALDQRIVETRRRLEWLADRSNREFDHDPHEATRIADVLRHAHDELNLVCESLSHREAIDQAQRHAQQLGQLTRCEQELVETIDALIGERGNLMRQFADRYHIPAEQFSKAFGDWCHCEDHPHLQQWLLSEACPPRPQEHDAYWARRRRLEQELGDMDAELLRSDDRIATARNGERHWAAEVERLGRHRPTIQDDRLWREQVQRELQEVEARLARLRRVDELRRERDLLASRLRTLEAGYVSGGSFTKVVSQWLQRLSDGQHQEFQVQYGQSLTVTVDQKPLQALNSIDVANVALAIRLAAAAALNYHGRPLPLVLDHLPAETARRLVKYHPHDCQWVLLTDQEDVVEVVGSRGGKVTRLHRPAPVARPRPVYQPAYDVNRELDAAWRETHGILDGEALPTLNHFVERNAYPVRQVRTPAPLEWIDNGTDISYLPVRDHQYRYDAPRQYASLPPRPHYLMDEEPQYFLSEDSAVDQAPSVDAVVAARLRGLGIINVGQLLAAEPALLAERLALSGVSAREVRQWQDEAKMVCRVRRLRAFDARVLVGCGVTDARQLASMHPTQLLERVQAFLATDRGRHILSSGSSYELSRITNWIVAANNPGAQRSGRVRRPERSHDEFHGLISPAGHSLYNELTHPEAASRDAGWDDQELARRRNERETRRKERHERLRRMDQPARLHRPAPVDSPVAHRETPRAPKLKPRDEERREPRSDLDDRKSKKKRRDKAEAHQLQFFLNRHDDVEAAPTIGHRLAEQLKAVGVHTVADLLNASPASLAEKLQLPKVTSDTVLAWQRQSTLVCRVPQLRGHDAQLLVAAGTTDAAQLAAANPHQLYDAVRAVAKTSEGKRFLRNAPPPDLDEVKQWVACAQSSRPIAAA